MRSSRLVAALLASACSASLPRSIPAPAPSAAPGVASTSSVAVASRRDGDVGAVTGVVRYHGEPAPQTAVPEHCRQFPDVRRAFRVGDGGVVGDVLVAVTDWTGEAPESPPDFVVELRSCGASPRTVALGPGQRLNIANRDPWPYTLTLEGSQGGRNAPTTLASGGVLALGAALAPGRYILTSDDGLIGVPVFVVRYATQAITDLRGRYRIEGVPVGKAELHAYIPSINVTIEKEIAVHNGDNEYDIEVP